MENFIILEEIAQTQFSRIVKAKNKKTKEICSLKIISEAKSTEAPSKETLRELLVLMNFEHENIIQFKSVFVNKSNICIEMAYCPNNLLNIICTISKPFTNNQVKKIIKSTAEALKYLHDNEIIHRDIKPSNILIDDECNIRLCDFGSSRICVKNKTFTSGVGTKWYKSPEILLGKKNYNKNVDVWSLGCIMAELFLLEPLFYGSSDYEVLSKIMESFGFSKEDDDYFQPGVNLLIKEPDMKYNIVNILDQCDSDSLDLISKMLIVNPSKRYTIEDVLAHPFLKETEKNKYGNTNLPI